MFRVAICDDEKYFRKSIEKYVRKYLEEKEIAFEIDTFSSGSQLIELGIEIVQYSVIFLDINMDEMDGIITAQRIREYSSEIYIVFVTAYIKYSLEGYKVDAARYILKDNINLDESIYECLDTIFKKMNYVVLRKTFKFNECEKTIPIERILYVESKLHRLEFHIMENELVIYTMYGTLNALEKEVQGMNFVRVHQSFLVNMKHIKSIGVSNVIMDNNQEITISRARYKDVRKEFVLYKGEI